MNNYEQVNNKQVNKIQNNDQENNIEPIQLTQTKKNIIFEKEQGYQKQQTEEEFFGINKKLYRNNKKSNQDVPPFKTGTQYIFLPNNPEFKLYSQEYAPMYEPKPFILQESIKREIQRICFLDTLLNRIVYDIQDPPPQTKDLDPKMYNMDMLPFYLPQSTQDTTLIFESRFQTGNLRRAIQLMEYQYQLILKADWNTMSHTQWFYFSVANTRKDVQYRFSIINMMKPDSLYNAGMKPLIYSDKEAKLKKIGWYRDGYEICYYQNNLKRKNAGFYYTLNFTLKFPHDNDTVYIAHCYPYTYTQLQRYLFKIEQNVNYRNRFQRKTLCQTIAGNNCDYVIIGDFTNGKQKKGIFLTSRVHPGQSMASYLIQNIIDFLIGESNIAKILRQNFIFKIVPMLNIDGVINGNYRCNLAGVDLNRQWIQPNKKNHPTIYHTKQLIKRMKQEREFLLYCDFHGHSRKKNIFIYGCAKDTSKKQQIFPGLMKNNCNVFSFKDCSFVLQKDRQGAARIALWKQLNIINCFTLQLSFCGAQFGKYEFKHFNLNTFKQIAESFCLSIYDCYQPDQVKVKLIMQQLEQNGLKLDKGGDQKGNNSDGDDSDYSNEQGKQVNTNQIGTNGGNDLKLIQKQKKNNEVRTSLVNNIKQEQIKNQLLIKKKINSSLPSKKKK